MTHVVSTATTEGAGEVYFAPAGTAPPGSTSRAALDAAGWQFIAQAEGFAEEVERQEMADWFDELKHHHLGITYRPAEPYRPNRATRRAAARDAKRAQR